MSLDIQKNELHYYVDLLRLKDMEQRSTEQAKVCVKALHNVIRTMSLSRNFKICGECFDNLDFGNIILNNIYFSDNCENPSSFRKCKFSEWNVHGGLLGRLYHVEFSDDCNNIVTLSNDGKAIVWNLESRMMKNVVSVCKPFKLFSEDEELADLSRERIFFDSEELNTPTNEAPNSSDIEAIKRDKLAEYFSSEHQGRKQFSDDVISDIINKFKEVNKKEFADPHFYDDFDDIVFPVEIFAGDTLVSKFAVNYKYQRGMLFSDPNINSIEISNRCTYCVLNYMNESYLFETDTGSIVKKSSDNIIVSSDERYYVVYSKKYFNVYTCGNNSMILNVCRNVQKISAVDIDIENGQALSISVGNNDWRNQPLFIWNLQQCRVFGKAMFNTSEMINYNIKYNPKFQSNELNELDKFALLSQIVSKNILKPRDNIIFDYSKNEDYDYFFWEIHYSMDESFCLVFELNDSFHYFQYQDKNKKMNVTDYRGNVICAVLTQNDKVLYLFTSYNTIYRWNTKQHYFIDNLDIKIPCELFITSAQFSTDGLYLFLGTDAGEVFLIDTINGKIIEKIYHMDSLHMENCNMEQVSADGITKKILYQNGANLFG